MSITFIGATWNFYQISPKNFLANSFSSLLSLFLFFGGLKLSMMTRISSLLMYC